MPDIFLSQLVPPFPLHWTTIVHYLMLLGTLVLLIGSGDDATLLFTMLLATFALLVGADLYLNMLLIPRVLIFLMRVAIFGLPLIIMGMAPSEETRAIGLAMAVLAIPLLALTFLTCYIGVPPFIDPRILTWCSLA